MSIVTLRKAILFSISKELIRIKFDFCKIVRNDIYDTAF